VTRRIEAALLALVLLFTAAVVVGEVIVKPTDRLGSPSQSRLRVVEDVFPPRQLTTGDIRRGGRTCLQGGTLVVNPGGGGCTFIVPDGVHLVVFRRVPTSSSMTVTLSQTGDLTQTVDTGRPGPDPRDPLQLRFAVVENGTTVTLSSCQGPAGCRLEVAG
jgi:hypothetical protein